MERKNMNNLKYNYVLFNSLDGRSWKTNPDGYYSICAEELNKYEGIKVVNAPLDYCSNFIRFIYSVHSSPALEKKLNIPFKYVWYPYYFKNDFKIEKPLCILLLHRQLPLSYLKYLKNKYSDCKIVLLHRDLRKVAERMAPKLLEDPNIDLEMTFDKGESIKFGFPHFNEFESKIEITLLNKPESDVYFAGKAKDRLPLLLEFYKKFTSMGLQCKYYLTGVPKNEQVCLPGIEYADRFITYREMLYHTVNTRFVLEINQGGCDGYTSRFLEAVMYNKKLITNNSFIKNSVFYNPKYIQIVNNPNELQDSFFNDEDVIDYHYNGEFSPLRMVERVEEELIKKFG